MGRREYKIDRHNSYEIERKNNNKWNKIERKNNNKWNEIEWKKNQWSKITIFTNSKA